MKSHSASCPRSHRLRFNLIIRVGIFVAAIALIAIPFFSVSSASITSKVANRDSSIVSQNSAAAAAAVKLTAPVSPPRKDSFNPFLLPVPPVGETIETFDSDCTTPKASFEVGQTVCVKVSGIPVGSFFARRVLLGNANSTIIQSFDVTSDPQTFSFVVTATSVIGGDTFDNRGTWHAVVLNPFFYYPESTNTFTVADPANFTADSAVATTLSPGGVQAGTAITFELEVKNYGPDSAAAVALTDAIPANTTFVDFQQVSGPTFNCTNPSPGASSGTTTCTITSLVWPGPPAHFIATYQVNAGTPASTEILNTADLASTTNDQNTVNNSTSDKAIVIETPAGQSCSFSCPENIVATATSPSGAIVTFASAINIEGDCGAISATPSSGSQFPVGVTTVNVGSGSGPSCSFTVTVVNTPAPMISCPTDKSATDNDDNGFETVVVGAPTTSPSTGLTVVGRRSDDIPATFDDDGNVVTPEVIVPLTDPYPIGVTGITWTATDESGRSATCSQRIIIAGVDNRPPVTISCPANVNVTAPSGSCQATIPASTIGTPTTVPSDSNVAVVGVRSDGQDLTDPFPAGATLITWTATDNANGSAASCTQNVTVIAGTGSDTTPPVLTVPANVTATTSSCTTILDDELGTPEASDNGACGGSVTVTRTGVPAGFAFPTGTTLITYTATDAAGNTVSGIQTVTVTESPGINPTITAPGDVSVNTGPGATSCGTVVSDATLGSATANDNCAGVTVTRTGVPAGNMFPVGATTVTYTATDKSGNIATDTQVVTVTDNTVPIITAPAAVTLYTGAGATSCGVTVSNLDGTLGVATANDNCPGVTVARNGVPAGNTFPLGTTTLTYLATDAYGNTASATQVVTVVDNTPPVVTPPANITVNLPLNSTATSMVVNYPNPATATDNCGGTINITYSPASGSTFSVGTTTVTVTATDVAGNVGTATFTVTVLYNFTGFFSPVDNLPTLNVVNAGRAIPVKFSLSGNKGLNIFAASSPYTVSINCDGSAPQNDVAETTTAGSSSLSYDAASDRYIYTWKTENSWANTCRQLVVKLNDGSEHRSNFKFR